MLELLTSPAARRPDAVHPSTRSRCEVCREDTDEVRRFRCARIHGFVVEVRICLDCLRSATGPER